MRIVQRTNVLVAWRAAVCLLGGLFAGCGSQLTVPRSHAPAQPRTGTSTTNTPTTRSQTVTQTQAAIPAPAPPVAYCRPGDLGIHYVESQGAAGSLIDTFAFVNVTSRRCHLSGYPGMSAYTRRGVLIPLTVTRNAAQNMIPTPVTLGGGGQAPFVVLVHPDATGLGRCERAYHLRFIPPGDTTSVEIVHPTTICGARATVSAVGHTGGGVPGGG